MNASKSSNAVPPASSSAPSDASANNHSTGAEESLEPLIVVPALPVLQGMLHGPQGLKVRGMGCVPVRALLLVIVPALKKYHRLHGPQ